MEQWSILIVRTNYVKYNRYPVDNYKLGVRTLVPKCHKGMYSNLEEDNEHIIDLGFGGT